jgi:uncharacterized protein (DUF433 family)
MFIYIASSPEILNGKPHIVGTRLSIEFILELFASGATKDDVIKAYPQLTTEAVEEVLKYTRQFSEMTEHVLNKNAELYKRLS